MVPVCLPRRVRVRQAVTWALGTCALMAVLGLWQTDRRLQRPASQLGVSVRLPLVVVQQTRQLDPPAGSDQALLARAGAGEPAAINLEDISHLEELSAAQIRELARKRRAQPLRADRPCDELAPGFCAPYVVIAGAPKCGTNALQKYLLRYPGTSGMTEASRLALRKAKGWAGEINWPWHDKPLSDPAHRREYASHFASTDWNTTFAIDKSTAYFNSRSASLAMSLIMPHSKVIVMLCDPARRVWSDLNQWYWKVQLDKEHGDARRYLEFHSCPLMQASFPEHVLAQLSEIEALVNSTSFPLACPMTKNFRTCSLCAYLRGSYYVDHAKAWRAAYQDNILFLNSDNLRNNPEVTVAMVLDFLGWRRSLYPPFRNLGEVNSHHQKDKKYVIACPEEARQRLQHFFGPSVKRLARLLHQDFSAWL